MASAQTHEQQDAIVRTRAEVNLLLGQYARRLKRRAEEISLGLMMEDPSRDPDEAGKAGFAAAAKEQKLLLIDGLADDS